MLANKGQWYFLVFTWVNLDAERCIKSKDTGSSLPFNPLYQHYNVTLAVRPHMYKNLFLNLKDRKNII